MSKRRVEWMGPEHRAWVESALHVHDSGGWQVYGNGTHILIVESAPREGEPFAEVIGEDGKNGYEFPFDSTFKYTDYFSPEEMGLPRPPKPKRTYTRKPKAAKGKKKPPTVAAATKAMYERMRRKYGSR